MCSIPAARVIFLSGCTNASRPSQRALNLLRVDRVVLQASGARVAQQPEAGSDAADDILEDSLCLCRSD